jgi:putative cell wall-binding protein
MGRVTLPRVPVRLSLALAVVLASSLVGATTAQANSSFDPLLPSARSGGGDRYETAALIATGDWVRATSVVVANGERNGIDALSASYLAGVLHAPILLTTHDGVPASTAAAIARLDPARVVVVGGESSISAASFAALTAHRVGERIAGDDRYETAELLVARGAQFSGSLPTQVFLARGDLYGSAVAADALAASPAAYHEGMPVLLTTTTELPEATADALYGLDPGFVLALGDENAVPDEQLDDVCDLTSACVIDRVSGQDRTATATALADWWGQGSHTVGLTNGYSIDALAAGPAAGKNRYPLLLTGSAVSAGEATLAYLRRNSADLWAARVFGDAKAVSAAALVEARSAAGGTAQVDPVPETERPSPVPFTVAPLRPGDRTLTVTFGADVDPASITPDDFQTRSVVQIVRSAVSVEYDAATRTATAHLFENAPFLVGDSVVLFPNSFTSASGTTFPASRTTVDTQVLAQAVLAGGTVSIDLPGVSPSLTPVVTEAVVGKDFAIVDGQSGRDFSVVGSTTGKTVTFDAPTAPGRYQYTVSLETAYEYQDPTPRVVASGDVVVS